MKKVSIKQIIFSCLTFVMVICAFCFGITIRFKSKSSQTNNTELSTFNSMNLVTSETATTYSSIQDYTVSSTIDSVSTETSYPWTVYNETNGVLQSGNIGVNSSVSVMKISVTGKGALVFDYRVYSDDSESQPDSLLISINNEITSSTSYSSFDGDRVYGATEWCHKIISLNDVEDGEETIVYIAFKKNGKDANPMPVADCALIKNIKFNNQAVSVTVTSSNSTFGSASSSGTYYAGTTITLTATTNAGGKVYGWMVNGQNVGFDGLEYSFVVGEDSEVIALIGSETQTCAFNYTQGLIYEDLEVCFNSVTAGDTVMIINDCTLSKNIVIPQGVTLYVPYSSEFDEDGSFDGTTSDSKYLATADKTYKKLTIAENVTLTVRGKLMVGGVISYPAQYYQGHTSGAHGRITNNGTIAVDGGRIDCYGFIDGSGVVNATSGEVYEPFIVFDFAGGNNCLELYLAGQNSFTQYTSQNISCTLVLQGTANLGLYCNLYASSIYNKINTVLIGDIEHYPSALVAYREGAVVTRTVDKTKTVSSATIPSDSSYGADLGKVKYSIDGGATLNNLEMVISGFSISVGKFPIPYCYEYELINGDYEMTQGWNIMPGASLKVDEDASLIVDGTLYVLDGLINKGMSGKYYPSTEKLVAAGFSPSGELIVNGTMTIKEGSTFGGIVQSEKIGAKVIVEAGAITNNLAVQFGANAQYDDNTCVMDLHGRIKMADGVSVLTPGKTYEVTSIDTWVNESYSVVEYASYTVTTKPTEGKYTCIASSKKNDGTYGQYKVYAGCETVTINKVMKGVFAEYEEIPSGEDTEFTLVNKTYYDDTDNTITTISTPVISDSKATFTVGLKDGVVGYVYIVKYSIGDGDSQVIECDDSGVYTINNPQEETVITVISIKKGDIDLDGDITAADVTKLRRYLAKSITSMEEMSMLAADVDADGDITAADVTRLRRYLAKSISSL